MKFEISLNGVKVTRDIPSNWNEVSFKQFIELSECGDDYIKIISVLTGVDGDTIKKAKIKNLDLLLNNIKFLNTKPKAYIPKTILGYGVPKDLGFESIGQLEDLKKEISRIKTLPPEHQILSYPLYCATYACKPYEWSKAEEMKDQFLNAPCLEVLGIGNFTLLKLIELRLPTGKNSQKQNTLLKKFRQALIIFRMRLVFMLHSFTWRKKLGTSEKSF